MKTVRIISTFIIALFLFLIVPQAIFCQTETNGVPQYTPPKGWSKTVNAGGVVFTAVNKTTKAFCILTIYASSASSGSPEDDFANKWSELVVKPFAAEANPKTESSMENGWTVIAGGVQVETNGIKPVVLLTVFSGFGKTASALVILSDQSYLAEANAVIESIKLDKTSASASPAPPIQNDPFPDRPGYAPQKPLTGTLKASITMEDLVGTWDHGAGSVQTYIDSSTGDYAGTSTSFYGEQYAIKTDGTFEYKFTGRANNRTVRESAHGRIILSGGNITIKFEGRTSHEYQLIAFMTEPNGAAILSLIEVGNGRTGYDAEWMSLECGHGDGFIRCVGGEEWARLARR